MQHRSGGNRKHQDVKQLTTRRLGQLDPDAVSQYDDDAEADDDVIRRANFRSRVINVRAQLLQNRQLLMSVSGNNYIVYRVTVRSLGRATRDYVMDSLCELTQDFIPFNVRQDGESNITFIVCTNEEAENIQFLSRRICSPINNDDKFIIVTKKIPAPWENLPKESKTLIHEAVQSRYKGTAGNLLDLSDFAGDSVFTEKLFRKMKLTRSSVLTEVILAARKTCPDAKILNLANNQLTNLFGFTSFTYACPNITQLNLQTNKIKFIEELSKLRKWKIQTLYLAYNPIYQEQRDDQALTSSIHDYLPYVTCIEGFLVACDPSKVSYDERRRAGFMYPTIKGPFCPNPEVHTRIMAMLGQFYEIYDSQEPNARNALVHAYDSDATFTMTSHISLEVLGGRKGKKDQVLHHSYALNTHNLLQDNDFAEKVSDVIHSGSVSICAALNKFPRTQHDFSSIIMEYVTITPAFLVVTLRGLFRDEQEMEKPKLFVRTFVIVPRGDDKLAIVNDKLMVSLMSEDELSQYKSLLKKITLTPSDSTSAQKPSTSAGSESLHQQMGQISVAGPTDVEKNEMISQLSEHSKMKPEWSRKCLEDTQWNLEGAWSAFITNRDQLPPDAFQ